jgi:hypothetical protein
VSGSVSDLEFVLDPDAGKPKLVAKKRRKRKKFML